VGVAGPDAQGERRATEGKAVGGVAAEGLSEALLVVARLVVDSPQPQMLFDADRRLVAISGPAAELRPGRVVGEALDDGFPLARRAEAAPLFAQVLAGERLVYRDTIATPRGLRPMEAVAQPVPGPSGAVGVLATFQVVRGSSDRDPSEFFAHFLRNLEDFPVALVEVDTEFRVGRWSPAAAKLFEWSAAEAIGRFAFDLIVPADERESRRANSADARTAGRVARESAFVTKSGVPTFDADDHHLGYVAIVSDVTERVEAERGLAAAEGRFRRLLEETPMLTTIVAADERIVFANAALCGKVGAGRHEVEGELWDVVFGAFPEDETVWERWRAGSLVPYYEGRIRDRDGNELLIGWTNTNIDDADGRTAHVASLGEDLTARRQAEAEARRLQEERLGLLSDLLNAETKERARLAEALHDDTIQAFVAAIILLDRLALRAPSDLLAEARAVLLEASDRARTLMFEHRPASLAEFGLPGAVRALCEHVSETASMDVVVDMPPGRYPAAIEELCYRTIREAVLNAQRHAQAETLRVTLAEADGGLVGLVEDDGVGYEPGARTRSDRGLHLGMHVMRERVIFANGELNVESAPGKGTKVRFRIPLPASAP
jgi:PAS domain S-box-containing protein